MTEREIEELMQPEWIGYHGKRPTGEYMNNNDPSLDNAIRALEDRDDG